MLRFRANASPSLPRFSLSLPRYSLSLRRLSLSLPRFSLSLPRFSLSLPRYSLSLRQLSLSLPRPAFRLSRFAVTLIGISLTSAAIATIGHAQAAPREIPKQPYTMAGKSPVYAPNGIAATSQPLATSTALKVLDNGGNAIDAAVAAAAVLSVVEPMMTGIGGDMFAIIWLAKEHKLVALNASGRAGSLMTRAELIKRGRTTTIPRGIETVTVPGALAGWQALLDKYGTLNLSQVLQPAIGYAQNGFPVTPVIAGDWAGQTNILRRDPGARSTFLRDSQPYKAGDWFVNADYARTLQQIAKDGPATFYGGALGQKLVARIKELGGFVTLADLQKNAPNWVTPISVPFKGYRIWEMPPSNQGIAALEMLRILEPYDLKKMGLNSAEYLHLMIEAKKLAYADLVKYVGDADHLTLTPAQMLSDAFINERRGHINLKKALTTVEPGPERVGGETIYLTVADKAGNMVSFINSNYDEFGSGIVVPGTGFVLHDRGAGFTLVDGLPNTVAPGKRPFHTLIPAFITKPGATPSADGSTDEPYMSFGLMGGAMQAQGHAQFVINHLVFGLNIQQAQDVGRFRHTAGMRVSIESVIEPAVITALRGMGHDMQIAAPSDFGGSQAIQKLAKGWVAGSDPRKDGHAGGN